MKKVVEHLIMIGIPAVLWIFAIAMDRVISKGILGGIMIFGFLAYTIFAVVVSWKRDKKDPIRIYIALGAFCFCIAMLLTM